MRTLRFLITALLCPFIFASGLYAQDLEKKISLKVKKAALTDVLRQLQEKEGIRFSYLNNELAGDTIRQFEMIDQPVSRVMDKLLEGSGAGYQWHNRQLIIKKGLPQTKPARAPKVPDTPTTTESPLAYTPEEEQPVAETEAVEPEPDRQANADIEIDIEKMSGEPVQNDGLLATVTEAPFFAIADSLEVAAASTVAEQDDSLAVEDSGLSYSDSTSGRQSSHLIEEFEQVIKDAERYIEEVENYLKNRRKEREKDTIDNEIKPFHFGLVYPISTNGVRAPELVNQVSVHLLLGMARGLEGVEFSGLGNIETEYIKGTQFAGLFNLVDGPVEGAQFAGLWNIAAEDLKGAQFSGLFSIADSVDGGQFSGLFNVAEETEGAQFAGLFNVSDGLSHGIQGSGFMNVAEDLEGVQLAGFLNVADRMEGFQAAGFLNIADDIRGSQLGFINIADRMESGVPIGFLSFIGNGYKALEVYTAEDFQANIAFKTGVTKFHNILAVGVEIDDQERWGFGYGIGSEWEFSRRFHLNTDLVYYRLIEHSYRTFPKEHFTVESLNNLAKFRLLATVQLGRNLALFGGPTYNATFSRYRETPEGPIGPGLQVGNVFYDRTYNNTNYKMWIGFNAGIRF